MHGLQRSDKGMAIIGAMLWGGRAMKRKDETMATNGTAIKRDVVEFPPNTPITISVKYSQPRIGQRPGGDDYAMFTTSDDRVMFLDCEVARRITELGVKPGQPFNMMLRWSGKKTDPRIYQVWLPDAPAPAATTYGAQANGTFTVPRSAPESDLERQLRESVELANYRKAHQNGNGANGVPPAAPPPQPTLKTTSQPQATTKPAVDAWDERIMSLTWKRLELYAALRERAAAQFGGLVDGNTVQAFLMNVLISSGGSSQ